MAFNSIYKLEALNTPVQYVTIWNNSYRGFLIGYYNLNILPVLSLAYFINQIYILLQQSILVETCHIHICNYAI